MPRKEFFEPGSKPSPCIFTPDAECPEFPHWNPIDAVRFLADIIPQTLFCISSHEGKNGPVVSQRLFQITAKIWGDRQVGFRCRQAALEAIQDSQPCDSCDGLRLAQVVVIAVTPWTQRAEALREMAFVSMNTLKIMRDSSPTGTFPRKQIILASCGPTNLSPAILSMVDFIDYADERGNPDLSKFEREMGRLSKGSDLFVPTDKVILIEPSDLDSSETAQTSPYSEAAENIAEVHEKIHDRETAANSSTSSQEIEQGTEQLHGSAKNPPSTPPPNAGVGPSKNSDEIRIVILNDSDGAKRTFIDAIIERLKDFGIRTTAEAFEEKQEYQAILQAEMLFEEEKNGAAVKAFLTGTYSDTSDLGHYRRARIGDCLELMRLPDILRLFFDPAIQMREKRLQLSAWTSEGPHRAELTINDENLRLQVGFTTIPVFVYESLLTTHAVNEIYELARKGPARTAILVRDQSDEFPVGKLYGECRGRTPPIYFVEMTCTDLKRIIKTARSGFTFFQDQIREHRGESAEVYLNGIDYVVCEDGKFFGRQAMIKDLVSKLRQGQNFAVFGVPRLGKSSLIHRLIRLNDLPGHVLVLVDLNVQAPESLKDVYYLVAREIRRTLKKKYPTDQFPATDFPALELERYSLFALDGGESLESFKRAFVQDIRSLLEALKSNEALQFKKLILLFDEVESIFPDGLGPGSAGLPDIDFLFKNIKALSDDSAFMLGMVGFGAALRTLSDDFGPLSDRVLLLPLGMLTDEECEEMIETIGRRAYVYYRRESLQTIVDLSGGHPQWTKYLCAATLQQRGRDKRTGLVTSEDVKKGLECLLGANEALGGSGIRSSDARDRLAKTFKRFARYYPEEAALLRQFASASEPCVPLSRDTLATDHFLSDLSGQLRRLVDYGLLRREDNERYRIRPGMLHHWLRATYPVSQL